MKRRLGETLADLVSSMNPDTSGAGLRVSSVHIDMPVQAEVRRQGADLEVLVDVPSWRWRTVFDRQPGRLRVSLQEEDLG